MDIQQKLVALYVRMDGFQERANLQRRQRLEPVRQNQVRLVLGVVGGTIKEFLPYAVQRLATCHGRPLNRTTLDTSFRI